jgi:hypothetical protein
MIKAYMDLDGTTLPEGARVVAHGCGEHFPEVPTADGVDEPKNRRVELFLFDDGIAPAPPEPTSPPGSAAYPAWREAVDQERTFTPGAAGHGDLLIATLIPVARAAELDLTFVLASTDGAYEQEQRAAERFVEVEGRGDLRFTGLPRLSHFTLVVRHPDGRESRVFDDVPFAELSALSRGLNDTVIPPHHPDA